jgi:hypothetical protein
VQTIDLRPHPRAFNAMRQLFSESIEALDKETRQLAAIEARLDDAQSFGTSDERRLLFDAIYLLSRQKYESIDQLRASIRELDHVDACNAAIREAGY